MKHLIGVLYLLTGVVGFAWAWYVHAMALYGAPFGWWNVVLYAGSVILIVGSILWWSTRGRWTRWVPIIGSGMLASLFLPRFLTNLPSVVEGIRHQPLWTLVGLGSVALIVISLIVAIRNRHVPTVG